MKIFIFALALIISIDSFSLGKKDAIDFFKLKHPEFASDIATDSILVREYGPKGLYLIVNEDLEEANIVYKKGSVLYSYFDELAKTLKTIFLVVQRRDYRYGDLSKLIYTSYTQDDFNFVLKVSNKKMISEALRRVHFYSKSDQLNLHLIQNKHIQKSNSHYDWESAYFIDDLKLNKFNNVSVSLRGFGKMSPEIYDGDVSSLLRAPQAISQTPFTRDNIVNFRQWQMWAGAIFNEDGELVANRSSTQLVKPGPFVSPVEYSPKALGSISTRISKLKCSSSFKDKTIK